MAIISRRLRYLFIHAPRTGGTALAGGVLLPRLHGVRLPECHVEVLNRRGQTRLVRQHITRGELIQAGLLTTEEADGLLTFTTVRNPFDAIVSSYVKKRDVIASAEWAARHPLTATRVAAAAELPFPEFVVREYGDRKPHHLYRRQLHDTDVVLRFEHLQADFDGLVDRLGVRDRIVIPRRNETPRQRDHRSYYTPEARAVVERVFAPDLERFGYEF